MHLGGRFAQTVGDRFQRIARRSLAEERPGVLRVGEAFFENPDGSDIILDRDYLGQLRTDGDNLAGPLTGLKEGRNRLCVW